MLILFGLIHPSDTVFTDANMTQPHQDEGKMTAGIENYWSDMEPPISDEMKKLLMRYSGIPELALATHVQAIRADAWQVFKYPCIGLYGFLRLVSSTLPVYDSVLERLKGGETLLDLGCGMGQEIRKLIFDGAPAENIDGLELERSFIDYGYDLFKDRAKLRSLFHVGDVLHTSTQTLGVQPFDIVMAIYFFHLFNWTEQVEVLTRVVRLLKPKSQSLIFGVQFGCENARSIPHSTSHSGEVFGHNAESWSKLVQEVAERTSMILQSKARLGNPIAFMNNGSLGSDFRWLSFEITVQ